MKSIYLFFFLIMINISCSKNSIEEVAINTNPNNLQNLGLSAQENIYPFWPNTWNSGLGDNMWYDYKRGDTLIVYRRDEVTDDSGDNIEYRFLVKKNCWIQPLNVKRTRYEATNYVDIYGNITLNPDNGVKFDKPIINLKIQDYQENQVLACEIETLNADYFLSYPLIDRMWIKLDD